MFERFSDRARRMVVYAADAAREHRHRAIGPEHLLAGILDAGGPAATALNSWGVTASALDGRLDAVSVAGSSSAAEHLPFTAMSKKVFAGAVRQTSLLGHEEIDTDHLLFALLTEPDSAGARILTDLAPVTVEEMLESLQHDLINNVPRAPCPVHRVPIRLSDDEYTRAQAAARTAGEDLGSWIHDRIIDALEQLE